LFIRARKFTEILSSCFVVSTSGTYSILEQAKPYSFLVKFDLRHPLAFSLANSLITGSVPSVKLLVLEVLAVTAKSQVLTPVV
jgi:hypothetical protein